MGFEIFDPSYHELLPKLYEDLVLSRQQIRKKIRERKVFDVIVFGGGIHGALFCATAAWNGLRVLLVEKGDFAVGASGFFPHALSEDLPRQVFSRLWYWRYLRSARRAWGEFLKYDLCGGLEGHRDCETYSPASASDDTTIAPCRVIQEALTFARLEGALVLNRLSVESFHTQKDQLVEALLRDHEKNESFPVRGGVLVNCANGAFADDAGRWQRRLPRGFRHVVGYQALLSTKIFIGPVEDMTVRVHDFPDGTRKILCLSYRDAHRGYDAKGFRERLSLASGSILADRVFFSSSGQDERPAEWLARGRMLSLFGGRVFGAFTDVAQGVEELFSMAGVQREVAPISSKVRSVAEIRQASADRFFSLGYSFQVPMEKLQQAWGRFGEQLRYLPSVRELFQPVGEHFLLGEFWLASVIELAVTDEDLALRRLGLYREYEHDRSAVSRDFARARELLAQVDFSSVQSSANSST